MTDQIADVVDAVVARDEDEDSGAGGRWARWKHRTVGGAPLFPLGVLFGLNMVDELDRAAFGILLPEIRDHFGLDTSGILTVVSISSIAALLLALPIGYFADRLRRVPIAAGGASIWSGFSVLTGLAQNLWVLGGARAGAGVGRAVNEPVHNSLLADYYDLPVRPRVYSLHRYANAAGQFAGPLVAGVLGYSFGWRTPFFVFAAMTAVFVVLALRLPEPVRGRYERRAADVEEGVADTEEDPPSWEESFRTVWEVRTLRQIFAALPFLAVAVTGLLALGGLYYEQEFGYDERARGFMAAGVEGVAQLAGLLIGAPLTARLMTRGASHVVRFLGIVSFVIAGAWVAFAYAPNIGWAIAANGVISASFFLLVPGIYVVLSMAVPAKVRAFGFAIGTLFILPGLLVLPTVGVLADSYGIRTGLALTAPVFVVGGLILASAGRFVDHDIEQVWRSSAARSEATLLRRKGTAKLLLVRGVDVRYDQLQILFGVDVEVGEGEIVALLGTNGAGKSTLLRAVIGLIQASGGAIVFDGRDITHTPPDEIARRGIAVVSGGEGVFGQLTVGENLRLASWAIEHDRADPVGDVFATFPSLLARLDDPAGDLSGGQQQMLALGMAMLRRPRLLIIDELSLGLAPAVVGDLLEVVRRLRDEGTSILLVEQSVNVALSVADRAYFLEKGTVRYEGPATPLLERPDLLRSVFLRSTRPGPADTEAAHSAVRVGDAVLEVRDVSCRFGGVQALSDVSFDVRPGEILGFLGPNGAGKSTLFDVISGTTTADAGSVLLRGRDGELVDLTALPVHRRARAGLGRSFQDGRLFPALTVVETISVALELRIDVRDPLAAALLLPSVAKSEERVQNEVDEIIDVLGLDRYRGRFVYELSTGTRRIVDLACTLAQQPAVVLLDEPSTGIAQAEVEQLAPVLRRVRDELAASLVVIEHDLSLLTSISDRLVALDLGRVVADGDPAVVVEDPAVVAAYLGDDRSAIGRSGGRVDDEPTHEREDLDGIEPR